YTDPHSFNELKINQEINVDIYGDELTGKNLAREVTLLNSEGSQTNREENQR
ncbi:MAG: hypothetical protein HY582_01265, partial [Candidatus Omnitrophica bacterium]|nr:hypothetical protein [Candidatus Omnitrophota bacterium]